MADPRPAPITADSLRRRNEWATTFPGSSVVWEEADDEGVGHGFDGLDPSAMVRALFRTAAPWPEVLWWYRDALESRGWQGREVKPWRWWEWTSADRPGERFDVLDRGRWPKRGEDLPGWPTPEENAGMTGYEVLFTARGDFSAPRPDDA
jgi:hypothetical protein